MLKHFAICLGAALLLSVISVAQEATSTAPKPAERVIGTVTAVDPANHTVTVKEDKTGTEYAVQLANAKTLLKVEPGAKDLKNATRITADDLATGDRVQVGGSTATDNPATDHPTEIVARSVILMSARELQQLHQAQSAEWQHSTAGVVTAVDAAAHTLNVTARTPEGPKPMVVDAAKAEFTRYSPDAPKTPAASQLADIQPGDQVRIIGSTNPGDASAEGSAVTAQKIYSSSFRTVVGTITSIAPDGKEITIRNLQTKQPIRVALNDGSAVRRLPPMMAYGLARRFNPDFRPPQGAGPGTGRGGAGGTGQGNAAGAPPYGAKAGEAAPGGSESGHATRGNGDLAQMLETLPKIGAADLKPGDAVVISGSPTGADKSQLQAMTVIAGVEPIFQSASPRQAQSLGDWGASLSGAGSTDSAGAPGGPPQ